MDTWACAWLSSARCSTSSSCTSNWPLRTRAPSAKAICDTRPATSGRSITLWRDQRAHGLGIVLQGDSFDLCHLNTRRAGTAATGCAGSGGTFGRCSGGPGIFRCFHRFVLHPPSTRQRGNETGYHHCAVYCFLGHESEDLGKMKG